MIRPGGPSRAASRRSAQRLGFALLLALAASLAGAALPDPDWHIPPPAAADGGQARPEASRLAAALASYRAIAAAGGWPPVADGPPLAAGARDARVEALRNRLRASGDWRAEMLADPWYFDRGVDEGLRRFQERHGLVATGMLEARSLAALNVTATERADQLAVNLERWRWLPRDLGLRHAWVNSAAATIEVVEAGRTVLAMRTIVGHPSRPTPSLASTIRQVVFNPTWSVPYTIAVEDLLPRQQEDPAYLARHRFRVLPGGDPDGRALDPAGIDWQRLRPGNFPYRLRQDAGPGNSLGRIKLVMDNPFDIYLHDTPERGLFDLSSRTLGSGCIRLEDARGFTTRLIASGRDWSAADTDRRIDTGRTTVIDLERPLPIYLVYLTAWVDEDGTVHFRRDLYGRDAPVLRSLSAGNR